MAVAASATAKTSGYVGGCVSYLPSTQQISEVASPSTANTTANITASFGGGFCPNPLPTFFLKFLSFSH